jgi:arabinoxylan arabinofuranohydrolase
MNPLRYLPLAAIASLALTLPCPADNPIIQTVFTADPAPMVHEGTLYLYTGHDEDTATDRSYLMRDYQLFTTTDMVNWTHHGAVLDIRQTFKWSGGDANAAQVIFRNGKFYYYVSTGNTDRAHGGIAIGVAVSDKPEGPFKDALGNALITNDQTKAATHGWDDLDPSVFLNDDGRAYVYWGNNACYAAELNDDMISLKSPIKQWLQTDKDSFGPDFEEAPWFYKRNGIYYLIYASQFPEFIRYATSKNPMGPWAFAGTLMQKPTRNGLGTIHPGICDFKGHSYFFYHTADLPRAGDKRRSVAVEEFSYNPDGTIPEIKPTKDGPKAVAKLNPFNKAQAETIAWASGIKTAKNDAVGVYVTDTKNGSSIKVKDVDFSAKSAAKFSASLAATVENTALELHFDSESGPLIATLRVKPTGSLDKWETQSTPATNATGTHDLYLKFTGPDNQALVNLDWWQFE